ncbi:MAG: nicotinate phosphoribosyltransferase, partial [Gammaproteobacteria bacterium]|nr:nicotinate phosphoribosyltransferase [Gammaproteobacteria bacterium]NIR97044.1 nicotinate phosphoribosyltransferase [Gammaproteobacteria bacterium]NIT62742.1 nicotinate phosphoribosyltransferase [Gammaproteobacteria bacterium]NIV19700.1 nicotinate phosphoribosyltransferase [Gammaproteobacteria bacterium]NIY31322.1 nicotinate phosphoribosyltransferase [Gammaproteobacteria bacterium]
PGNGWQYKLKLSEHKAKISIPGRLQVYRCEDGAGKFIADAILDLSEDATTVPRIIDPNDNTKTKSLRATAQREALLTPVFDGGTVVYDP